MTAFLLPKFLSAIGKRVSVETEWGVRIPFIVNSGKDSPIPTPSPSKGKDLNAAFSPPYVWGGAGGGVIFIHTPAITLFYQNSASLSDIYNPLP